MLPKKKQCLLTTFLLGSDSTPATPSCDASDFDETVEMSESSDCEHTHLYTKGSFYLVGNCYFHGLRKVNKQIFYNQISPKISIDILER